MRFAESKAARLHARFVALVNTFATPERIRNYTHLMAGILLLGGILNMSLGEGLLDLTGDVLGADFLAFYTGAKLYLQGQLVAAYDAGPGFQFPAQLEFQNALLDPQKVKSVHPFVNPPYAVVLYLPFAVLSYRYAVLCWWGFSLAIFISSIWLLRRELPALQRWPVWKLGAGSFFFFPTFSWLAYGQTTAVTLFVYTGTFVLLRRERDFAAGACLGCLAFKPQLALMLGFVLLFRWRALVAGAAVLAVWQVFGWWMAPEAMRHYYGMGPQLTELIRFEGYPTWGVHSLFGFAVLLLDGVSRLAADWSAALLSGAALAGVLWQWWRTGWQPGSPRWDLLMASTFALGLIVSPHLYFYDLMLLLLPFAIVLNQHRGPVFGGLLGGGPVLAWTVVVWILSILGNELTKGQRWLTEGLACGPIAAQFSTIAIVAWAVSVMWLVRADEARCSSA